MREAILLTAPCRAGIFPGMKTPDKATLVAGAIFVIAASIFVSTMEPEPPPVQNLNTMLLKPALRMTVAIAEPGATSEERSLFHDTAATLLEPVAGLPLMREQDHLEGAAAAAAVGAKQLVPLFAGNAVETDPGAGVLVKWALDPTFVPDLDDLARLRSMNIDPEYRDLAVLAVMDGTGLVLVESLLVAHRRTVLETWSAALLIVFMFLLSWGVIAWVRWQKPQPAKAPGEKHPLDLGLLAAPTAVYIWFMVLFLSVSLLAPTIIARIAPDMTAPTMLLISYLVIASGGIAIALRYGATGAEPSWHQILGVSLRPGTAAPAGGALVGGLRGYAMMWPIVIIATMLSAFTGDQGAGSDSIEHLILAGASLQDKALLILSSVVLAPIFEELLFRGFFYRRLRALMTPFGAAALSGMVFAATHMSAPGFLQIWAIGFTLALTYEHTGRLRSSMLAHAIWNLETLLAMFFIYG